MPLLTMESGRSTGGLASRPATGLNFSVARSLKEVLEAWHLVYDAYRTDDLIDANPYEIHTTPHAVGPNTAVILACLGPLAVGTLSVYADSAEGMPLDTVYRPEIEAIRQSGRRLMEVGLFADRRQHMNRAAEGLFELMRYAYYFGMHLGIDDAIIGVHPRHAPFYMRLLAFEKIGAVRTYPTVKDRSVVLLRLRLTERLDRNPLPKGLAYFRESPLTEEAFADRFRFDNAAVASSPLSRFLAARTERSSSAA